MTTTIAKCLKVKDQTQKTAEVGLAIILIGVPVFATTLNRPVHPYLRQNFFAYAPVFPGGVSVATGGPIGDQNGISSSSNVRS